MKKTLRNIHEELKIKQTLKIYVNNTNKKYRTSYLPDEVLSDTTYFIIWFNTLGKLRRHKEQYSFMSKVLVAETKAELLETEVERLGKSNKLASSIVEKDNLKDAYIKTLKEYAFCATHITIQERTRKFLSEIGIKYAEYLTGQGIEVIFKDRIKWFEKELKKSEL